MSRRRATLWPSDRHDAGRRTNAERKAGRPGIVGRVTFRGMQNMDPAILAKSGTEHAHQQAYFQWLLNWNREVHRHTFAIPNGGARGDDARMAAKRGSELKAEGVKRGVPDIMVAWPLLHQGAGLFIEMKIAKGGVTSDFQKEWHERLTARGYYVVTCYNWQEAANATARYFGQSAPYRGASDGLKFSSQAKPGNS